MINETLMVFLAALMVLNGSWIILLILPKKKDTGEDKPPNVSVVIPAHNEEKYIRNTVESALNNRYSGEKEVIVVDDGSTDKTSEIVEALCRKNPNARLLKTDHLGKSRALNQGIEKAENEILVLLDADSMMDENALRDIVKPFRDERVGAVSGIIRAADNINPLTWFQDFEYILSSCWRYACNKLDATYILPGFSAYRRSAIKKVECFSQDTLCEDFDIGLKLKKAGYRLDMSPAKMYTEVPKTIKGLIKQRIRWSKGTIQVIRKHLDAPFNMKYGAIGLYGIPTQLYWYIHGCFCLPITAYQILDGYNQYFIAYGDYISEGAFMYFFSWMSAYGMFNYITKTFTGEYAMTMVFIFSFASFMIGTAYNLAAILKISKLSWKHLTVIFFFFPYSVSMLLVHITAGIHEAILIRPQASVNIWEKSI